MFETNLSPWISGLALLFLVLAMDLVLVVDRRYRRASARTQFAACFDTAPAYHHLSRDGLDAKVDIVEPEASEPDPKRFRRWPYNT